MKRYQVVELVKLQNKAQKSYCYKVVLHDSRGRNGLFATWIYNTPRKKVIELIRAEGDIEVSKHVENGGKLRTH